MKIFHDTFPTSAGDFSIALDESGTLLATAFGAPSTLTARIQPKSVIRTLVPVAAAEANPAVRSAAQRARSQVEEYFSGERQTFDLPLASHGSAFQRAVWRALQEIPFGETRTYAAIAAQLDRPAAARAVGRANATNPICLIVPCHRVIGANGSLTGFAFGEEIKQRLLEHEGALAPAFA